MHSQKVNKIVTWAMSLSFTAIFCVLAPPAFAHGGFDHVIGNVVTVSNNVLTVKTSTGNVDVKLDSKTEVTKNKQKAQVVDLVPGARVVIDLPEGGKDKIAHAVKIGGAPAAPAHSGHEDTHENTGQHAHQ
jgi:hypothetical protein